MGNVRFFEEVDRLEIGDILQFAGETRLKKVEEGFYKVTDVSNGIVTFKALSSNGNAVGKEYNFLAYQLLAKMKNKGANWDLLMDEYDMQLNSLRIIRTPITWKQVYKVALIPFEGEVKEFGIFSELEQAKLFVQENKDSIKWLKVIQTYEIEMKK